MSEAMVKKYVVRLTTGKGKNAAALILKARTLLKADISDAGQGWSDGHIVKALDTSLAAAHRLRQRLVEEAFDAALARKPRAAVDRTDLRCREGGEADHAGLGDRRRRRLAARRTRRLDSALGRGLPGEGPREGGDRPCPRLGQTPRAFPVEPGRLFPRHGREGEGRRAQSHPHHLRAETGERARGEGAIMSRMGQVRLP